MKKIIKNDLVELRKQELARKELEFQVGRDLRIESEKRDVIEKSLEDKNPFILGCINFFGTMFFGYLALGAVKFILWRYYARTAYRWPS